MAEGDPSNRLVAVEIRLGWMRDAGGIVGDYGYPALTDQAKRKILGGNLARLHGFDADAKAKELGVPA